MLTYEANPEGRSRVPLNAIALSLFFAVMAAFAPYAAIQNAMPYWAEMHNAFYHAPGAPNDLFDRATGNVSMLRLSAWPAVGFVAFQLVAIVSVSRVFPRRRGARFLARWTGSAVFALAMSGVFLFSIWWHDQSREPMVGCGIWRDERETFRALAPDDGI